MKLLNEEVVTKDPVSMVVPPLLDIGTVKVEPSPTVKSIPPGDEDAVTRFPVAIPNKLPVNDPLSEYALIPMIFY